MLDATKTRFPDIEEGDQPAQQDRWGDRTSFWTFVEKARQRRHMIMVLTLGGAAVGWAVSLGYVAVKVPTFSASSELLISNTMLQSSGTDAVATQVSRIPSSRARSKC